jgi:DnaJ like chaperone protein
VLGLTQSASEEEVKKAYRRLMSQNHPDKLVAKGLPEEMMKLAKEKTQKITKAYETVQQARKNDR